MRERQRAEIVKNLLAERGFVSIADIMSATGASAASARRDAGRLAEAGYAERLHGGIQAVGDAFSRPMSPRPLATRSFDASRTINIAAKRAIARRAVEMCATGDVVIINGGTTTFEMADFLRGTRLKILTNSYPLAEFLIHETQNRVALPGGEVYRDQKLIVAAFDDDAIQHYSARLMFMSAAFDRAARRDRGRRPDRPRRDQAPEARRQASGAGGRLQIHRPRQPRRLPAVAHFRAHHRLGRAGGGARHAGAGGRAHGRRRPRGEQHGGGMRDTVTKPPLLEAREIEKAFPGVRALSGVSFEVKAGEVHALLGENGAGKSTLIKILSGVYQADGGAILIDGREARFATPEDAKRAGVATIYQELLLFPELTVAENIFLGHAPLAGAGRIDWRAMRTRAEALLASLEIDDLAADQIVGALSVGNRQRVEILRALSHDARILIMDEPTAALTESDVTRLFDIVRRLKARGVGIVYISHRLDEIFAIADRVTVLRDGAYVGARAVADTTSAELVQMMVGRRIDNLFPKTVAPIGRPVLEARDIVRRPMTKGVSLVVRAGEIVGLAGLVGSGRSEFAQTIFGVTPAELGEIRLLGAIVRIDSPESARAKGIAYVPEDRGVQGLVRPMSVLHNFSLAALGSLARAGFIDRAAERRMAEEGVQRFSVKTSSVDEIAGRLSGGNQQKIVLGKWLVNNPKLLILDEPTRGIDVGAKAEIHRLMSELAGTGVAILMISSELPEVLGMSDRVLVMREGRLVAEFDRVRATSEAVGAAMMGEEPTVEKAA